jgi:hypothetical protein
MSVDDAAHVFIASSMSQWHSRPEIAISPRRGALALVGMNA